MKRKGFKGNPGGNRGFGASVRTAAFISALFLSLLCCTLYNMWHYDVVRYQTEDGNYHARLTGEIGEAELEKIQSYANVEQAWVNEEKSEGNETAVDVLLKNVSAAYEDLPRIAALAGLREEDVSYHENLLNYYFVVNPNSPDSRDAYLILMVFAAAGIISCFSLITIIHHAYGVFMNDKIRELGILSSIGASPGQLRRGLLKEAFRLSILPAGAGMLLGIAAGAGLIGWMNGIAGSVIEDRLKVPFSYHPMILLLTLLCIVLTVLFSAWMPARRLSHLTPLEAIRGTGEMELKKPKKSGILCRLFGIEGELAGNALKARKKALRTSSFSLTLSFLAFGFVQCLFAVMTLNTDLTYFDKYQNVWDVMAVVSDTDIEDFEKTEEVKSLPGARDALIYQKASAKRLVTEQELSREFLEAGGFERAPEQYVIGTDGGWLVNVPVYILDDASFLAYCGHVGAEQSLDGAVILNQVRDDRDPNFRVSSFFPYLKEYQTSEVLRRAGEEETGVEIPVLGYAGELPVMREEYQTLDYYEMVQILPVSLWTEIKEQIGGTENGTCIRLLAGDSGDDAYTEIPAEKEPSEEELETLEAELKEAAGSSYTLETENRIGDRRASDAANRALQTILGGFCVLLALIGIGNVFSNTLSFTWQRRRETARYLSVGMTPGQLAKMFCVEALALAGRPVLISLPVLFAASWLFMKSAYLDPALLLPRAPVVPVLCFALAVFGSVGLAYYLGCRRLLRMDLAEALRDETFS